MHLRSATLSATQHIGAASCGAPSCSAVRHRRRAMAETPLTVMIPLGGVGSRFQKEGYTNPKPFVSALGKPMILWVIDSLLLQGGGARQRT